MCKDLGWIHLHQVMPNDKSLVNMEMKLCAVQNVGNFLVAG